LKRVFALGLAGIVALSLGVVPSRADNLGVANDFNVFTLGNDYQFGTDAAGRVGVGGTADFTHGGGSGYTVNNSALSGTSLLVGGAYTNTGNTVKGTAYVNGNATWTTPSLTGSLFGNSNVTFSGGGTVGGSINLVTGKTYTHDEGYSPFSTPSTVGSPYQIAAGSIATGNPGAQTTIPAYFSSASSYLTGHSTGWGALAANGATNLTTNDITLQHGATNALLTDIFLVSGDQLKNGSSLTINANSGYSVLVNVTALADNTNTFPSINITLNGTDKTHVLYNFSRATGGLVANHVGINGSLLAPFSDLTFNSGYIDGTLIANNLINGVDGGGESHNFQFAGSLPSVTGAATPEPGSVALFGAALLSGEYLLRRRRK
jgi:choice-of-anchor A domain-containing protein